MNPVYMLSAIVFLPALAALVIAMLPRGMENFIRFFTFVVTLVVLLLTGYVFFLGDATSFSTADAYMQDVFNVGWIPSFDIYYYMGVDGISLPLVVLTALISMLAMGASWSITKHVKAYCILFLLLETGMLGVFMALDFFLFYVFWEVMLLPMYFLIGVWGGPRREYAAIKFFLFTLVGSVFMLIAMLLLYFNSDLRELAKRSELYDGGKPAVSWERLRVHDRVAEKFEAARQVVAYTGSEEILFRVAAGGRGQQDPVVAEWNATEKTVTLRMLSGHGTAAEVMEAVNASDDLPGFASLATELPADDGSFKRSWIPVMPDEPVHTFNILALSALGQQTDVFSESLQWWCFVLLFVGFAIKVPAVPVHTWLPDAHVEAPTPISMILAGVLLKMGGYGILRFCYPICPHGGYDLMWVVCIIGVVSMVYGAFAALAQTDFKRMVAYSSVSHMGYVVLGLGVWSAGAEQAYNPAYWNQGIQGAMFQMIAHGISSAGMFFMVGIIYDRVHHRDLNQFGGLFAKMPFYTALAMGLFFAGLGLPGLCGFIGEVFVVLSVFQFSIVLAVISAGVVILTAAYILWALQRVYLGAEYRGPHEEDITPSNPRERAIGVVLLALAILFGVAPKLVFDYMSPTITRQTSELAEWTKQVKVPLELEREAVRKEAEQLAADAAAQRDAARRAAPPAAPVESTSSPAPPAESVTSLPATGAESGSGAASQPGAGQVASEPEALDVAGE